MLGRKIFFLLRSYSDLICFLNVILEQCGVECQPAENTPLLGWQRLQKEYRHVETGDVQPQSDFIRVLGCEFLVICSLTSNLRQPAACRGLSLINPSQESQATGNVLN